ncbi:PPOX class F420-dependent oxidoreductase [Umezawaea sp. Da 62-37]|uniref:PPOX class F420-dependent oxidoreductase n=1 Tax=Umezawaea sp. Da 62-37 TaxID=3075927 RepID=UPI0028F72DB2|nr:PPOX class F420-dependent oxidoreductase [Umezawaea sp. Da 62-37]WNV89665.1 PPOX class F420-dependent oxidoreductase [Umezawaea sp. Da 62-37]
MTSELGEGKYLLLTTYRKDGRAVPTPVWVVADGGQLFAWSATDSGKVKRIRRDGKVSVGPCDVRGKPTGGSVDAQAELLDESGSDRVRGLIGKKYGIAGKLTLLGSRLRRGRTGSIGIAIVPSTGG